MTITAIKTLAINGFNHLLVVKQSGFKHFFRLVDISDVECLIFIHIYNLWNFYYAVHIISDGSSNSNKISKIADNKLDNTKQSGMIEFEKGVTKEVQETIADLSSKIILRRNGTAIEEVYAISRDSGRILSHTKGKANYCLDMSDNFKKVLINAKEGSIIILHNHPLNFTFSLNDVHTMSKYLSIGIMIASTHKGEVHYVTGTIGNYSQIERDYRVAYTKNSTSLMYSEEKSRINALKGSLEKAGVRYDYK